MHHFAVQSRCCKLSALQFFWKGKINWHSLSLCVPRRHSDSSREARVSGVQVRGGRCRPAHLQALLHSERLSVALPAAQEPEEAQPLVLSCWQVAAQRDRLEAQQGAHPAGHVHRGRTYLVANRQTKMRTTSRLIMTWSKEANGYCLLFAFLLHASCRPRPRPYMVQLGWHYHVISQAPVRKSRPRAKQEQVGQHAWVCLLSHHVSFSGTICNWHKNLDS